MQEWLKYRFALAWTMPLAVGLGAAVSPATAWAVLVLIQATLALAERVPALRHSPAATAQSRWHRLCVQIHVPLQAALLGWCLWLAAQPGFTAYGALALGVAVGGVTGSQGITFAHEVGHSKSRFDCGLAWGLMGSVNYAHFMVEHYRGHHVRAATWDDPASARHGESLWRFLPRTLAGSWASAWRLEARQLGQLKRGWPRSPLLWACVLQALWMALVLAVAGPLALLFWLVQSAYAIFLLEAINYIEHYGLQRRLVDGRPEPFAMQHAWNADHTLTNCFIANLPRHSDHHMHAWKPYATLDALPGPQLPSGYAGCLFLSLLPPLWFGVMHRRMAA